ncbi:hypothetical protein GQ44DRAFT_595961, partial [Phaeosphaeriaceae sp. PMI808]
MASGLENTFNKALERFRNNLTEEQKREFSAASFEKVESEIQSIQHRFGSEKRLRNLKRISKFLEAMKQIEEVVKVFLNVHGVVAFVWAKTNRLFKVAGTRIDILERLLDTYVEIGEVIPGLRQYDQLFKNCPTVREVLEWYLCDIFEFHRKAFDLYTKPAWKTDLKYPWKTFETSFRPILDSLKRHRSLLSDEKLTAAIAEIQDIRKLTVAKSDELSQQLHNRFQELLKQLYESQEGLRKKEAGQEQEALRQQRRIIEEKLGPPDYEADQRRALEQCFSSSGEWILKDQNFLNWLHPRNPSNSILYMHGMPGAGKTTLVSRIIAHLRSQRKASTTPLLFFYFKHHEETKRSMDGMLRAILVQLLYQDDTLVEYFYQKCCSTSTSELVANLKELAVKSLKSQHRCLIVLDGLDECGGDQDIEHKESGGIIEWFKNAIIPTSHSEGRCIQLLLAGQRDGVLNQHLSAYPGINLDTTNAHICDIRGYAESRTSEIGERFSLSHDSQAEIIERVIAASKGRMFLYAKVVLDNLMHQGSEAELADELKTENFPDGLNSAYTRVIVRVLERPARPKREAAARILGWIICAARPLQWREIQSRFCINFEQGCCDSKNRRSDSCKVLCGSLVEAENCNCETASKAEKCNCGTASVVISLVHDTAGKYLIHTGRIRLFDEHVKTAIFCSRYLASGPFKHDLRERSIQYFALSGYYGFQDYAVASWHFHIDSILNLEANSTEELSDDIVRSVICLFREYEVTQQTGSITLGPQPDLAAQQIREILQAWRSNGQKDSFEERTTSIRRVVELIDPAELDDARQRVFLYFNGVPRFKCPKPRCQQFSLGFMDRQTRDAHVDEHLRPFKCPNEGCYARSTGFPSQSDLDRHVKRLHSDNGSSRPWFPSSAKKTADIFAACKRGDLDAVKAFTYQGVDVNVPSQPKGQLTPLVLAARHGEVLICQHLVQHGAQVYSSNSTKSRGAVTAFGEAIAQQDYDLFRVLVETAGEHERLAFLGGSSTPNLQYYVQAAVASGAVEILKDLLSWYEQSSDTAGDTILHKSWEWKGGEAITRILLSRMESKDINRLKDVGETPLHGAVRLGKVNIVRLLLEAGADANTRDKKGRLPIYGACTNRDPKFDSILAMLLDHTDDLDYPDNSGETLLQVAMRYNQTGAVARLLEENRSNLNAKDSKGRTALHLAAERGYEAVVKLL